MLSSQECIAFLTGTQNRVFSAKYYWNSETLKSTAFCFDAKLIFHSLLSQVLGPTVSPTPTCLLLHNPMPSTFPPPSPFAFQLISTCAEAASSICSVLPPQPWFPAITAPISLPSVTSPGEHSPTHLQRIIDSNVRLIIVSISFFSAVSPVFFFFPPWYLHGI